MSGGNVDGLNILLTNDDGLDRPGLLSLAEYLTEAGANVEIVAPASNVSGSGIARSSSVRCTRVQRGQIVEGSPADCVAYASRGLETDCDLVVSGCNLGPNAGLYVLCQSGTAGAAAEGAWLGLPAIAVSGYAGDSLFPRPPEDFSFDVAGEALE